MPSPESMSSAMEAAVGSLKESLPADLAPRVDEATQKLENGREEGKQINEARHTLRELRGEVLARAGEFANLLLSELKKNPAVPKEELQQKVEDNPKLTKPQKAFFEKAVEIADEDREAADSVKNDVQAHALKYLIEIYGKDKIPFTPEQINLGNPKVLGAIIFARECEAPPNGDVVLAGNPLMIELLIKNPVDINKIYDPKRDVVRSDKNEELALVAGFARPKAYIGEPKDVYLIAILDNKDAVESQKHEFGHYLGRLHQRTKTAFSTENYRELFSIEGAEGILDELSYNEVRLFGNQPEEKYVQGYKKALSELTELFLNKAADELQTAYRSGKEFESICRGHKIHVPFGSDMPLYYPYDYPYNFFHPRWPGMPTRAKELTKQSMDEYQTTLTEQLEYTEKVAAVIVKYGLGENAREKFQALMHEYPLPQWKVRIGEAFDGADGQVPRKLDTKSSS